MKVPFLYEEKEPIEVSLSRIYELMSLLEELGCIEQFLEKAETNKMSITIPKSTINFMKLFLFEGKHHKENTESRIIITSATCPKKPDPDPPVTRG